jgi:hypothetical protein
MYGQSTQKLGNGPLQTTGHKNSHIFLVLYLIPEEVIIPYSNLDEYNSK